MNRKFENEMNRVLLEKMVCFYREIHSILRNPYIGIPSKYLRIFNTVNSAESKIAEEASAFISNNIFTLNGVKKLKLPKQHISFKSIKMGKSIHICLN